MSNILQAKVRIKGTRPLFWHKFGPDALPLEKQERTGVAGRGAARRGIAWVIRHFLPKFLATKPNQIFRLAAYPLTASSFAVAVRSRHKTGKHIRLRRHHRLLPNHRRGSIRHSHQHRSLILAVILPGRPTPIHPIFHSKNIQGCPFSLGNIQVSAW